VRIICSKEVEVGDMMQGKLKEWGGKIRQQWAKLTDDDVEQTRGDWEELSGRLQKTYGYTKEQAREEIDKFKQTMQ
jgi:uncharacterized protein YjbJ (UPF0337 family)